MISVKMKKILCFFLTAALIIIVFSCTKKENDDVEKNGNVAWTDEDINIEHDEIKTVIKSYDEYENTEYPLLAEDSVNNTQLYGIKPQGAVLFKDGKKQIFDWSCLTPRGILPEITMADFDGDGLSEIGVNLYWASGTGMSIEQLYILKPSKDDSGNDYFVDYQFTADDYAVQLAEILQHSYDSENKILTLQVQDKIYTIQLSQGFQYMNYVDIVQFRFDNNKIKAIFPLGIVQEGVVAEYGYGSLTADVEYRNSKFTLTNFEFDEKLDISLLHRKQIQ